MHNLHTCFLIHELIRFYTVKILIEKVDLVQAVLRRLRCHRQKLRQEGDRLHRRRQRRDHPVPEGDGEEVLHLAGYNLRHFHGKTRGQFHESKVKSKIPPGGISHNFN